MTQASTVDLSVSDGIATLLLNRPHRLNAINPALLRDLAAALEQATGDSSVAAIVLGGHGRAFCAGDDLKEFEAQVGDGSREAVRSYVEDIQVVTRLLMERPVPVVGAIHGWAVGGGFSWVLNCDLVVMAEDCRCFLPESSLGLFVTGAASSLLPNLVGLQKAKELIWFGERIDARTAHELGIAWRLVPSGRHLEEARAVAAKLAKLPPLARANVKRVLNHAYALPPDRAMALETEATIAGFRDPMTRQRIEAAMTS